MRTMKEVFANFKTYRSRIAGVFLFVMALGTLYVTNNLEGRTDQLEAQIQDNTVRIDAYYTALSREQDARRAEGKAPVAPAAVDIAQNPQVVDDIESAPLPNRETKVIRESVDPEVIRRIVAEELDKRNSRPLPPGTLQEIAKAAAVYVPKPADGKPPTPEQIQAAAEMAVAKVCANDACKGKQGDQGEQGRTPTSEELDALITARLAAICDGSCEGAEGKEGPMGPEGPAGQDGRNVIQITYVDTDTTIEVQCKQVWTFDRGEPISAAVPANLCTNIVE